MTQHRHANGSQTFYPITIFYVIAVAALILTVLGFFTVALAVVFLAVIAVWLIQFANWRETRSVHTLVNGQKHELMTEIADLKELLRDAGKQVPASASEKRDQTPKEDSDE